MLTLQIYIFLTSLSSFAANEMNGEMCEIHYRQKFSEEREKITARFRDECSRGRFTEQQVSDCMNVKTDGNSLFESIDEREKEALKECYGRKQDT